MNIDFVFTTLDELYVLIRPTVHSFYYRLMSNFTREETPYYFSFIDYFKIDDIFVNGIAVEWEILNASHPLEGVVVDPQTNIEIHYSSFQDRYRYIVKEGENVVHVCNQIISTENDKEATREEYIIYATLQFENKKTSIEYSRELNEYILKPLDEDIFESDGFSMKELFQWDKMFVREEPVKDCDIFIVDKFKREYSFRI